MSNFLIVGKKFSNLTNKILERGDDYILLQDRLAAKNPDKKLKKRLVVSFEDTDKLAEEIRNLPIKIDGIVTVYENYVLAAAHIAEKLGLPGMPLSSAEACTDKQIMRQLFAKCDTKISPDFCEVKSEAQLIDFANSHSFPLILKPANLQKSLLVTKNHNLDELLSNYRKTIEQIDTIYSRYAPHRKAKLLVEEFIEGTIHSVDAFVDNAGEPHVLEHVVDYQTGYDIGFDDNFHYSRILPSRLCREDIDAIRETAALGCKALGMKNSPAHVEIILTSSGPQIVEIGARNGGYRERMHRLANGLDLTSIALDTALGKPIRIEPTKNDACAVLELFPKSNGIFQGIKHEAELVNLESLTYFAIKQPIGSHAGKAADGYKMCAIIILSNSDQARFVEDLAFINNYVTVVTE